MTKEEESEWHLKHIKKAVSDIAYLYGVSVMNYTSECKDCERKANHDENGAIKK